jgi:hypothetical protein
MSRRETLLTAGCALALCITLGTRVEAQRIALAEGDRLRITWRTSMSNSAEGRYAPSPPDSLSFVTGEGVRLTVPTAAVTRMELGIGTRNRGREVGLIGAGVGAVVGAVVGAASAKKDVSPVGESSYPTLGDPATGGVIGALGGGLAGVFIGTWIGRGMKTVNWQRVSPNMINVSVGLRVVR